MNNLGPRPFRFKVLWLLLAASVLMALPALRGDVLGYDDRNLLLGDEGAFARSPGSFFTSLYYFAYLPFYGLSYWLDGAIGGDSAAVVHLGNVLFHAATSYLVFCVLVLLFADKVAALFGALIFAVHPLHVESVAWISGRKEVLSGFFMFLAWLLFLKEKRGWAIAVFLVACFSKATAVVLPGLLFVAALLLPRYENDRKGALKATLPFFLAALLPVIVHLAVGARAGVVKGVVGSDDFGLRLLSAIAAWGRSVSHAVVPLDLSIDYPEGRAPSFSAALPGLLYLAAAAGAAVVLLRRGHRAAVFGIAAFFVALAPHNNIFPATDVTMADRYLYLPLFGVAVVVAWAGALRHEGRVALAAVAVVLTVLSFISSGRFRSDEELWTRTIAARDDSALAYYQRGTARVERANRATPPDIAVLDDGIADLEASLARVTLLEHKFLSNAALVLPLLIRGRAADALERGVAAEQLLCEPTTAGGRRALAQLLYHRGLVRKAQREWLLAAVDLKRADDLWSRYLSAYELGLALFLARRPDEARAALNDAAARDRDAVAPLIIKANVERMVGDMAAYKRALEDAATRAPGSGEVAEGWVKYWLYGPKPDFLKAGESLKKLAAGSERRTRLEGQVMAAHALFKFRRGDLASAVALADRARNVGLGDAPEQYDLGQVYMEAGRYDDAVACFRASGDVLARRPIHREAVARAYALKANALLRAELPAQAKAAMRSALDAKPRVIEAGAAPLRGEIERLRQAKEEDLLLLAAACVAGDPSTGKPLAESLLKREMSKADRSLAFWLRGLMRSFALYDFPGAAEDFRTVIKREPKNNWGRYRLAQVGVKSGASWMRTADQIKSVERREQGRAEVLGAIKLLTTMISEDRDFLDARMLRGQAYFALDRLADAKADYVHVREHSKRMKEVYLHEAALHRLSYVKGGSVETLLNAENFLKQALALDPNYFEALFELGNVYHLLYDKPGAATQISRKQAFVDAVLWYRRAMALNRHVKGPRVEWATLLLKAGQEALTAGEILRAHQLVARLEEEAPEIAMVHKQRVHVCLLPEFGRKTKTKPDEVFAMVEKALDKFAALAPDDADLPRLRSSYHRARGESYFLTYGRYLVAAKRAATLEDKQRAAVLAAKRDRARELTLEQWKKALMAWPSDPENMGIRDRLRDLDPGYVELDRKKAEDAMERGRAAWAKGRYREAASAFGEASGLFPAEVHFRFLHGMALARAGWLDKAVPELEHVANHERGRDFPEACYELGNIFSVKRNRAVANAWYKRYISTMESLGKGDTPAAKRVRELIKEPK